MEKHCEIMLANNIMFINKIPFVMMKSYTITMKK